MSLDNPKSRKDIKNEIANREKDMQKRLERAERVLKDKKTESELARALKLQGTSEGIDAIKKAVHDAANATDQEHHKQQAEMNMEVFEKSKEAEQVLKERAGAARQDAADFRKTSSKIETAAAKSQFEAAEQAAEQDRQHLEEAKETQESQRKKGEADVRKQTEELKATKVSFGR